MYGTVAQLQLKPGGEARLRELVKSYEGLKIDGHVNTTVYRLDRDANQFIMAVVFRDRASYIKNAEDPGQDKRFQEMRALLAGEPEWSDGEVIYTQA